MQIKADLKKNPTDKDQVYLYGRMDHKDNCKLSVSYSLRDTEFEKVPLLKSKKGYFTIKRNVIAIKGVLIDANGYEWPIANPSKSDKQLPILIPLDSE